MPKKKRTPFHFVEGQGWCYHTNIVLPTGDRVSLSGRWFNTKGEAIADYEIKKDKAIRREPSAPAEAFYEAFLDDFEAYRSLTCRSSTVNTIDKYKIPMYITPHFQGKRMKEAFSVKTIRAWYSNLRARTDIGQNAKSKILCLMKTMLKFAYQNLYINADTYQLCDVSLVPIKWNHAEEREITVWKREECIRFLSVIPNGSEDEVILNTFVDAAMRISEFLAIKVEDFDFAHTSLSVNKQVHYDMGSWSVDSQLKTESSRRTVFISDATAKLLRAYIVNLNLQPGQFIFSCKPNHKEPMSQTSFRRLWKTYIELAGVPYSNPHAIRHYKVSEAAKHINTLEEAKIVADQMGHSVNVSFQAYLENNQNGFAKDIAEKIAKA